MSCGSQSAQILSEVEQNYSQRANTPSFFYLQKSVYSPSMISGTDISLHFGARELFHDISFRIGPRDRIGLVGSNGSGKSTLLRMLMGEQAPDAGAVAKANYVSVGYLPQEGMYSEGRTLF